MVCIAAFLALLVLSAISAKYRVLLKKAWYCVTRRVTFRPCDTTFGEDIKASLLAPLALRAPSWVKPAAAAITVFAWLMVISTVVSLYVLVRSGLNLAVYGTCNKQNSEACSLAAASCAIGVEHPTFTQSLFSGDVIGAFRNEFTEMADTIATIPSRFRDWEPTNYVAPYASYKNGYNPALPTALDVIDPGCVICAQLFRNIGESGLSDNVNLTYLLYPILQDDGTPKFPYSIKIAHLLTAIRIYEYDRDGGTVASPTDWRLLEKIFVGTRPGTEVTNQLWLNEFASPEVADAALRDWLTEFGYTPAQINAVFELAESDEVAQIVADGRVVVRDEIRTVTIPTLITEGRMFRGLATVDQLAP